MLSSTYQLAAMDDPTERRGRPRQRLPLAGNRRRLEVEPWRDAMLAVSGKLDPTIGGPSSRPRLASNRRRTYYAKVSRHSLDGLLRLFDFPDPNITADKRAVTAVPLQQLFVLNSEFMERQAKALAAKLTAGRRRRRLEESAGPSRSSTPAPPPRPRWHLAVEFLKGQRRGQTAAQPLGAVRPGVAGVERVPLRGLTISSTGQGRCLLSKR